MALSASQATWLFFRSPEDLKAEERENLQQLKQASPDLETAYQLVKEFLQMVHEREPENGLRSGWTKCKPVISKPFNPL
jgi:ferric-dicitrate binding protein FerR (iron transport regulator)